MATVTTEELKAYLTEVGEDAEQALPTLITDAKTIVDGWLGAKVVTVADPTLKLLYKNMAAHLYLMTKERGGLTSKKIGESSETYAKTVGDGLRSTSFGRMVLALDPTGLLEKVDPGVKKKAQFRLA